MKKIWNKIPKWVWVLVVIAPLAIYGFNSIAAYGTWRYKITVTIETPEGIKTGSAVRELSNSDSTIKLDLPDAGNPPDDFKGEAVVVDLGARGVVFAVMGTDDYWAFYNSFPVEGPATMDGIRYYNRLKNAKASLALKDRPLMVTFKDIKDPKTVMPVYHVTEGVDHAGQTNGTFTAEDQFEKVFGEGARLADVTIETTNEPVTSVVGEYLGWLTGMTTALDGSKYVTSSDLANMIGAGSFKKEE